MCDHLLNELQLLTAMYDTADIRFDDPEVLNLVENCIPISDSVSLSVRLNSSLELDIRLPQGYPDTERLSAYCRLSQKKGEKDRKTLQQWESEFNNQLSQNYLLTPGKSGDDAPTILGLIQWCNEQLETSPIPSASSDKTGLSSGTNSCHLASDSEMLCRIWIFSHHIYNKNKRKFLVNTADELDLSGFSLPGKPGFICVEGEPDNCDEFWSRVRQLCWQKISLIERQSFPRSEIIFEGKPFEELHCDKAAFIRFLEAKNSSAVITDYLGI